MMNFTGGRLSALGEVFAGIFRRPLSFLLSIGALALVFASAIVCAAIARALPIDPPSWMQAQALVLVAGAEGEVDLAAVRSAISQVAPVAASEFVGRDVALARLAQRKGLTSIGLEELKPNPLPDAFAVRFAPGASPDAVEAAIAQLRKLHNVEGVEYPPEPYRKLSTLLQAARLVVVGGAVFLGASLAIAIGLVAAAWPRVDAQEVEVLHLLGADPAVVRRPYVYSGALYFLLGAAGAWGSLAGAAHWLAPALGDLAQKYSLAWSMDPPALGTGLAFCFFAACFGAMIASGAAYLAGRRVLAAQYP
jgi:cell division transport system permease protein